MEKIHYQTNTTFPSENTVFSLAQPRNQLNLGQDTSIFNSTDLQPEPTALNSVEFVVVVWLVYTFPYAASIYRNVSLSGL